MLVSLFVPHFQFFPQEIWYPRAVSRFNFSFDNYFSTRVLHVCKKMSSINAGVSQTIGTVDKPVISPRRVRPRQVHGRTPGRLRGHAIQNICLHRHHLLIRFRQLLRLHQHSHQLSRLHQLIRLHQLVQSKVIRPAIQRSRPRRHTQPERLSPRRSSSTRPSPARPI